MWLNGLMLLMVVAIAKCSETELTVEAAFQGRCGHNSPCEQLCYELHDGMYECDCSEGFELNKNGYSCQEINSTLQPGGDLNSKTEEDVLYQKGASFSAKLESDVNGNDLDLDSNSSSNDDNNYNNDHNNDNNDDEDDDEDDDVGDIDIHDNLSDINMENGDSGAVVSSKTDDSFVDSSRELYPDTESIRKVKSKIVHENDIKNTATTTDKTIISVTSAEMHLYYNPDDDNYYMKQEDISVYDDVNNNRLNLRQYDVQTYQSDTKSRTNQHDTSRSYNLNITNNKINRHNNNKNNNNNNKSNDKSQNINNNNNNNHSNITSHKYNNNNKNNNINSYSSANYSYNYNNNSSVMAIISNSGNSSRSSNFRDISSSYSNTIQNGDNSHISATVNGGFGDVGANSSSVQQMEPCLLDCGTEGICEFSQDGRSKRCLCPFGKTGLGCNEDMKINTPRFTKKSWLAFPALRGAYKHVQLRVEFRPESLDGIILLTGERDDLTGDFMALLIHQGFIEFWFDCGSGTGSVRSKETVLLNQWNSVTIYRHRWDAWLVLNHGERMQGRSQGLFSRITFREPVFLGGTGNITGLAKRLPIYDGIIGCIRRFIANEHEYKFSEHPFGDVTKGFAIEECTTDKCTKSPCRHGGKCLPSDQGAVCLCPLGYGGDLCEMRLDLQIPSFNGSSYLRYAPLGDSALIWLELQIIIKPEAESGVILYSGHEEYGDYIALSLNMGFIEFAFDLGSGPALVRSEYPLSMRQWHTVKISRTARLAVLKIDQLPEVMTISSNGFWHLSLPHSWYLGGSHNEQSMPLDLKEKGSFVGCIQKVELNGRSISIISEALGGTNVDNCPHACADKPCGPLAQCVPLLDNYECRCNPFNAQCNKAEEVPLKQMEIGTNRVQQEQEEQQQQEKQQEPHQSNRNRNNQNSNSREDVVNVNKEYNFIQQQQQQQQQQDDPIVQSQSRNVYPLEMSQKESQQDNEQNEDDDTSDSSSSSSREDPEDSDEDDNLDYVDYLYEIKPIHKSSTTPASRNNKKKKINLKDNNPPRSVKTVVGRYMSVDTERLLKHEKDTLKQKGKKHQTRPRFMPSSKSSTEFLSLAPSSSHSSTDTRKQVPIIATTLIKTSRHLIHKHKQPDLLDYISDDGNYDYPNFKSSSSLLSMEEPEITKSKSGKVTSRKREYPHRNNHNTKGDNVESPDKNHNHNNEEKDINKSSITDYMNGATDFQTRELIQDMERIMKNSNDIRAKENYGMSAFRRSHGACFTGTDSYFHYNDAETMSQIISYRIDLNLRFKTHSNYGVILWSGRQSALDSDDFLSLGIENGYLHLRYNLGSGEINIEFNSTRVSDGLWHRVRAIRNLQDGSLEVDGRKSVVQRSPGKLRQLNTDTGLFVGGMPDVQYYTRRRYFTGIIGCISEIVLAGEVRLNLDPATLGTAHNVEVGIL